MYKGMTRRSFIFASGATLLALASGAYGGSVSSKAASPLESWILKSPDSGLLNDLELPSFEGIPCFGLPFRKNTEMFRHYLAMQNSWNALRRLAPLVPHLDIARLKKGRKWRTPYDLDVQQYSPNDGYAAYNIDRQAMQAIQTIVTYQFNDAGYNKYFAGARNGLDQTHGQLSRSHTYKFGGALASEIEERKAYTAFMDEAMQVIMQWAQSPALMEEVQIIKEIRLPPYDFKGSGFVFPMEQFTKAAAGRINKQEEQRLLALNIFETTLLRKRVFGALVKMPAGQAESLVKSIGRKPIYSVFRQQSALPENVDLTRPFIYEAFIKGEHIRLYTDTTFSQKILDIPLT